MSLCLSVCLSVCLPACLSLSLSLCVCVCSWWYSYDRREANKQLMLPGNPSGTFLIRNAAGSLPVP